MEDVIKVASYICKCYEYQFGTRIDEIKLQILLYFIQRECIVQMEKPLFDATFLANSFGPYVLEVHSAFVKNELNDVLSQTSLSKYKPIFDKVFVPLATKKTRSLVNLAHGEYSWREAFEHGEGTTMSYSDIAKDANRFRVRCFLLNNMDKIRKPVYVYENNRSATRGASCVKV